MFCCLKSRQLRTDSDLHAQHRNGCQFQKSINNRSAKWWGVCYHGSPTHDTADRRQTHGYSLLLTNCHLLSTFCSHLLNCFYILFVRYTEKYGCYSRGSFSFLQSSLCELERLVPGTTRPLVYTHQHWPIELSHCFGLKSPS